jgi:hypothetical protein
MKTMNSLKIALLALIIVVATSCKKNKADNECKDEPAVTYPEENFLDGYLSQTSYNQSQTVTGIGVLGSSEYGLEFEPLENGKITALVIKLPEANNSLRVTIWDKATATIIKRETVDVAAANTDQAFDIADIDLVKNKQYAISIYALKTFINRRTNSSDATYPLTIGNIKILAHKFIFNPITSGPIAGSGYPNVNIKNSYYGNYSFKFQRTN